MFLFTVFIFLKDTIVLVVGIVVVVVVVVVVVLVVVVFHDVDELVLLCTVVNIGYRYCYRYCFKLFRSCFINVNHKR